MKLNYVYVAGPYTKPDPVENVRKTIYIADKIRAAGLFPYVPHLTMLWHLISGHDYEYWMELDFGWVRKCDCLLRLPGESSGADREVALASALGMPIFRSVEELLADPRVR